MIVALTGATGFVGQAVLDGADDVSIRALTRRPQPARAGVEWVAGDLAAPAALAALVQGADAVLHVAGVVNAPDAAGFEAGNVTGTAALIAAAQDAGVRRFVLVSSLSARAPHLSDYGASKARAEALVRAAPLDWTIVRPPAVYGPRDREMLDLFRAARWGVVPVPAGGRVSLIHVDDLARLLLALVAGDPGETHACYEPDDGAAHGWANRALGQAIARASGRPDALVVPVPPLALSLAARADRLLRGARAKLTPDRARYMAHRDWVVSAAAAVPAALWQARIDTQQGLIDTAGWYRAAGWL